MARFIGFYPAYTFETVLAMPWHRFITAFRVLNPEAFPEHFARMLGTDAVDEAERIIAMYQRNREAGRGIQPTRPTDEGPNASADSGAAPR